MLKRPPYMIEACDNTTTAGFGRDAAGDDVKSEVNIIIIIQCAPV